MDSEKILAIATRNNKLESIHKGWVVVTDFDGNILKGTHKEFPKVFTRSALKPIQALPFLLHNGLDKFGLTTKELALIIGSHSAEDEQVQIVKKILDIIGLSEKDLKCGSHYPLNEKFKNKLIKEAKEPSQLHCNCSGKHAGMLAVCLLNGWSIDDYIEYEHPLQKEIRFHISNLLNIPEQELEWGIDGCSLPTYSIRLNKLAEFFAKVVNSEKFPKYTNAFNLIKSTIVQYPHLIAGEGRIDTQILKAYPNKCISKMGAEGVLGFGLLEEKIGIAIKIEDGSNRAMLPIIIKTLENLGIDVKNIDGLNRLKSLAIYNNFQSIVGFLESNYNF